MRRPLWRVGLVVGLALAGCRGDGETQEVEFRVPVAVQEVGRGTVEDLIVTTGTLRATAGVVVSVETPGLLTLATTSAGRRLAEGDRVQAGQTLGVITGEEARLEARMEATERRYQTALQELESRRRLLAEGVIAEQDVRNLEATVEEMRLERDRSRLAESKTRLVSPIPGVILRLARDEQDLPVADGQLVSRGFALARIAPIERLIADVDLVGPDLARVRSGQRARVRHSAWKERFEGSVVRLAPTLDPVTHTLRAEVEVMNSQGLLRPGMFVEVALVAERREEVPVVPRQAVTERGGRTVVFVLASQRVSRREVILGLGDDEVVEVRQGVEPGERVVVRGLETLTDETRVRVSTSQ